MLDWPETGTAEIMIHEAGEPLQQFAKHSMLKNSVFFDHEPK